ncbi:hypothetical protein FOZ60_016699 [Perkinsus olseni]|uniref:Uncharacterized protein n=1 Tax=Perkinsus olseni TaxID=32597 RepID=A0A7J6P3X6_PEROL|nr:hypothetical protein FOZ60_016699 [Perkinsus olseni]
MDRKVRENLPQYISKETEISEDDSDKLRAEFRDDIRVLQRAPTDDIFAEGARLFDSKWKQTHPELAKYFRKQWLCVFHDTAVRWRGKIVVSKEAQGNPMYLTREKLMKLREADAIPPSPLKGRLRKRRRSGFNSAGSEGLAQSSDPSVPTVTEPTYEPTCTATNDKTHPDRSNVPEILPSPQGRTLSVGGCDSDGKRPKYSLRLFSPSIIVGGSDVLDDESIDGEREAVEDILTFEPRSPTDETNAVPSPPLRERLRKKQRPNFNLLEQGKWVMQDRSCAK